MTWTNYHTHSHFCDGVGEPQAYVEQALKENLKALGFSSHAPLPFEDDWTLTFDTLPTYCDTIKELKKQHAPELPIYLSLEIDYIPDEASPTAAKFQTVGLDYTIGAVHFAGLDHQGKPWSIDHTPEIFAEGLALVYNNQVQPAVELYYHLVREMIEHHCPDIVAHLDLIKKNNTQGKYFGEEEAWYQVAVIQTLDVLAESSAILEVNTGGLARGRTDSFYPSPWILELCYERNIPLTLNADAHQPNLLTAEFSNAATLLQTIGYQALYIFDQDHWRPCPFSKNGLID